MERDQNRGHCQGCGRLQAANPSMAKHGYTVEHGYFEGVCFGAHHAPLEHKRDLLDRVIPDVMAKVEKDEDRALRLEQREEDPPGKEVREYKGGGRGGTLRFVPYEELSQYDRDWCRKVMVMNLRQNAKAGRDWIEMMQKLADKVHGQPLVVAKVRVGPVLHAAGGHYGVQCAASRYGAQRIWNTTKDWDKVNCAKCLKDKPANEGGAA